MASKVVFLDRDGTINVDYGYVTDPQKLTLFEGVAAGIAALQAGGFKVLIITNQSAISRGMASRQDVIRTNQRLLEMLLEQNKEAVIDQVIFSEGKPGDEDDTRKPQIGMLRELEFDYDKANSFMIGDKMSDVEFGLNAGLKKENCILLTSSEIKSDYEYQALNLNIAIEMILNE